MAGPAYRVAHLDDLPEFRSPDGEELDHRFLMVRRHLGIRSFDVNAMVAAAAGDTIVGEHSELAEGSPHEELYYVARGQAEFTVDGETVDAPEGTFVYVPDPATVRSAVARAAETVVIGIGGEPGAVFAPSSWEDAWAGA